MATTLYGIKNCELFFIKVPHNGVCLLAPASIGLR